MPKSFKRTYTESVPKATVKPVVAAVKIDPVNQFNVSGRLKQLKGINGRNKAIMKDLFGD